MSSTNERWPLMLLARLRLPTWPLSSRPQCASSSIEYHTRHRRAAACFDCRPRLSRKKVVRVYRTRSAPAYHSRRHVTTRPPRTLNGKPLPSRQPVRPPPSDPPGYATQVQPVRRRRHQLHHPPRRRPRSNDGRLMNQFRRDQPRRRCHPPGRSAASWETSMRTLASRRRRRCLYLTRTPRWQPGP